MKMRVKNRMLTFVFMLVYVTIIIILSYLSAFPASAAPVNTKDTNQSYYYYPGETAKKANTQPTDTAGNLVSQNPFRTTPTASATINPTNRQSPALTDTGAGLQLLPTKTPSDTPLPTQKPTSEVSIVSESASNTRQVLLALLTIVSFLAIVALIIILIVNKMKRRPLRPYVIALFISIAIFIASAILFVTID